jgi:predicted SAM-dependent methyltransferase
MSGNSRVSCTARVIALPLFELAVVLVRIDHVASHITNANDRVVRAAELLREADRIGGRIRFAVPQATEWQSIAN